MVQVSSIDEIGAKLLDVEDAVVLKQGPASHGWLWLASADGQVAVVDGNLGVFQTPVLASGERNMLELLDVARTS